MVTLNKIYTRTGDKGKTRLATGEEVPKTNLRLAAYGTIDECNSFIGVARLHVGADTELDAILMRIQNDLFDLGADLATPDTGKDLGYEPLRIIASQVTRLENEIDFMNANIAPLDSFILPAGSPLSAHLHVARTIARRAEREIAALIETGEKISEPAFIYINRLSDLLFVAARRANNEGKDDVKWVPAGNR
jgi:cob(I)alamin adenosyltransferase